MTVTQHLDSRDRACWLPNMFLTWWSVALPAAFASTCFTCCLQDGVIPQERKNLFNPAGESYPVGIWQSVWSYSAVFTAIIKIGIEEKLGYNAVWQNRANSVEGIYALAGCTDPEYLDPETYFNNFSAKGCGPSITRTQIMVAMYNDTYVADAMQNIQHHYPHMLPQLYLTNIERSFAGPAVFPSEIAAGQLVSLNLSLHAAYHADNKLALGQVFSNIVDVDVSKLVRCGDVQISEKYLQDYMAVTGDRDGGFYSSDTACPGGYFWLAPSCRSDSTSCIPFLYLWSWSVPEMMQKSAFWNIPLAMAKVEREWHYLNTVQGHKTMFFWNFPEHRQLAESAAGDPKLILFPMEDASSYIPGNYTLGYGMWDVGLMGVSKDLSSLAPAVDSFVSKVNVTIEQMTEIVRQHKQLSDNTGQFHESDEMYSLACDWLKKNPDTLELWLVTTSTTTGQSTSTTDGTTAGIASTTGQTTSSGTQHDIDDPDITVAMGSRNALDVFLFSMLCLKARMSI